MREHRVGTITLGVGLVFCGIIFLARLWFSFISYEVILKLWPVIFLLLGGEILVSNMKAKKDGAAFKYDGVSIILIATLVVFTMGVAAIGCATQSYWLAIR